MVFTQKNVIFLVNQFFRFLSKNKQNKFFDSEKKIFDPKNFSKSENVVFTLKNGNFFKKSIFFDF